MSELFKRWHPDKVYLSVAKVLAKRSTCLDKQVGCILVSRDNKVLATGYNGAPSGFNHCTDAGYCSKDFFGTNQRCMSAHAEQNALLQCSKPDEIYTAYCTLSPCVVCIKMLLNTTCQRIVFAIEHGHIEPKLLWRGEWIKYDCNL